MLQKFKNTLLVKAIISGKVEVAKLLIKIGANPRHENDFPIFLSYLLKNKTMINLMEKYKINLSTDKANVHVDNKYALLYAANRGKIL